MNIFCNHCKKNISKVEVWFLKDINNFTSRKLIYAVCPVCKEQIITLVEKRISDNKVFISKNISGINAVKTLYRERKRLVSQNFKIDVSDLFGWIYGVNKEIVNKKGEVTQVRQYSSDFFGNKKIVKKIKAK